MTEFSGTGSIIGDVFASYGFNMQAPSMTLSSPMVISPTSVLQLSSSLAYTGASVTADAMLAAQLGVGAEWSAAESAGLVLPGSTQSVVDQIGADGSAYVRVRTHKSVGMSSRL